MNCDLKFKMRIIFSNVLLVLTFFALNSNQVSAVPIVESDKNYLDFNGIYDNDINFEEQEDYFEQDLPLSKVDPGIAEDARLDTVRN